MGKRRQINAANPPEQVRELAKWLRQNLYLVQEDGALFTRVVVRHIVNGKRGDEVFYRQVPKRVKDDWCDTGAAEIYQALVTEAHSLGGLQKYACYAFSSEDNENHFSRFVLRIQGHDEEDEDHNPLDSEGPDKRGLTSQAMRHAEAFAKIQTSSQMTTTATLQGLVSQLGGMVTELMDARRKDFEVLEEAMSRKSEREIELMKAQARAKALGAIGERLGLFLPAVANKIAGQNLFPVQANAVMMMVKGLVTSIAGDEEKMTAMMKLLSPEQAVVFMNVLEEVSKNVGDNGLPTDGTNATGNGVNPSAGDH